MSLKGSTNEEKIWNYLKANGLSDSGVAGLMGNLYAESGLIPTNLQNTYESKLRCTDDSYTAAVDGGTYRNFAEDCAGYGLAQWTYRTRKAALLAYAQAEGKSIGDLDMQLGFLMKELGQSYKNLLATLKSTNSVRVASDAVLLQFERPADQSEAAKSKRAGYGQTYYDKYAGATTASTRGETTMTKRELRNQVVSIAQGWLGYKESDGSHKKIIDLYNSHKPLACGYAVKYNDAWCATFVSAVAIKAGLTDIIPTECSCPRQIEAFRKLRSWQESDSYVPSPGDIIYYDWQDDVNYAVTDNAGVADHVGIVEAVSGNTITVIEGNYSDSVKRRTLAVNGKYIRGYGVPDYASKATTVGSVSNGTSSAASTTTTTTTPATASTTEKKAVEAAKSLDKTLAGTYTVTAASGLNIRNGAGTGKSSLAILPKGTKVQNYGYYTLANDIKWLYIQATLNGVKYTGFSSIQWLKKV